MSSPKSFPPGAIIGLNIKDPRQTKATTKKAIDCTPYKEWPVEVAASFIWDQASRSHTFDDRIAVVSQGEFNLVPTKDVMIVPILLIQRSVKQVSKDDIELCGWDLVAPRGWAMSLLNLFNYSGARIGGLNERSIGLFEAGLPTFPHDYPETNSFLKDALQKESLMQAKYDRTPILKKVHYKENGILSPFRPPFEILLSLDTPSKLIIFHSSRSIEIIQNSLRIKSSWDKFISDTTCALNDVVKRRKLVMTNLDNNSLSRAFVRVKVSLGAGRASSNSTLYYLSPEESYVKFGFTTSGSFSLSNGKSSAIGTCTLKGLHAAVEYQIFFKNLVSPKFHPCSIQIIS